MNRFKFFRNECASLECKVIDYCLKCDGESFCFVNQSLKYIEYIEYNNRRIFENNLKRREEILKIVFESFSRFFLWKWRSIKWGEESFVLLIIIGSFKTKVCLCLLIFEGKLLFTSDPRDAINVSSSYGRIFREIGSRDTQFRLRTLG